MAYDLKFFKRKESTLSGDDVQGYLTEHLNENGSCWYAEVGATGAYFFFENIENTDEIEGEDDEFGDFESINISFSLNFIRLDFFGFASFNFVIQFINDLDLYIYNPQSPSEEGIPVKYSEEELYKDWSTRNASISSNYFKEYNLNYYPIDKSNYFYEYNLRLEEFQDALGDNYNVPKMFFYKTFKEDKLCTGAAWIRELPSILPKVDYVFVLVERWKWFKRTEELKVVAYGVFIEEMKGLLEEYEFENCKIMNTNSVKKAQHILNNLAYEGWVKDFGKSIRTDLVVNVQEE